MNILKIWENISFWTKIFFSSDWSIKKSAINLLKENSNTINKNKTWEFVVDYPWEYEKYNIYILSLNWNTNRLNFFIQDFDEKKYFAFIQDPSVLENLDLPKYPSKWYYLDDIVLNQLERLGFDWELIKIEE